MKDITLIPHSELETDLKVSIADIKICQAALDCGITHHRDGLPVQSRIDSNRQIIARIEGELAKRKAEWEAINPVS